MRIREDVLRFHGQTRFIMDETQVLAPEVTQIKPYPTTTSRNLTFKPGAERVTLYTINAAEFRVVCHCPLSPRDIPHVVSKIYLRLGSIVGDVVLLLW